MKKYVIFDVDGTILHSFPLVNEAINYATKMSVNIVYDDETILNNYGADEEGILKNLLKDKFTPYTFSYYLDFYLNNHDKFIPSFINGIEDIFKSLLDLKIPLIILTGRSKESLDISLTKLNAYKYFINYYVGSKLGQNKVNNFYKIIDDYKVKKEDLLYIGDSINDIKACNEVGIDIISANYDKTIRSVDLSKYNQLVAHTTIELKELILNIVK